MIKLTEEAGFEPARLDRDYNAKATVSPEAFAAEMVRYRETSIAPRADWGRHFDVVYDEESGQRIDIFGPPSRSGPCPVFVFVHGGYWRALSKEDSAMMAGMLAAEGIATVVVDYRLAPEVSLAEITREVRAALAFVWRHGGEYGLDPDRIAVGGSSAGGHLAGALVAEGWQDDFGLPSDVVKFAMPVSGLFELAPLAATFPQEWLNLGPADVDQLSPIRHIPVRGCPIAVAWAEHEADGFKRQSRAYAEGWAAAGGEAKTIEVANRNHYDILMDWCSSETEMSRALLAGIRNIG
ncbi:alpha/beta hydrolase [Ochrobactrum sp. WV_118_8]|uniref:alpha/beta hydrolase n=1 Tax=Brucella anthropi TaxID=529 RepID=UPI0004534C40|nr:MULTISPECIES: alpha/beta hydrolase [Brucella/Ochrobactrum group]EXL03319.1 alpha/beta hydrolase [Brucella anthropi]KAB2756496.1 alpha/beta hydrolase [Brucella anthropi]KIU69367.1 alpha/beta hydrolase [Brucella anthropi]MCR8492517.1 alpha/beta hydrolase [Brucella anthropi]NIH75166.1 arylformamidase [Ochrobactrum sp. P20RRXII]